MPGFVIDAIQFEAEDDEGFVDFERLAQVTAALIVNHVVAEVEVGQDLRLEEVLGDLTGTGLADLVVREVQLGDCLVKHEALDQYSNQVIIDQVSWQR